MSVQYRGQHVCGGSIINENWVITAARCVRGLKRCYSIRAGSLYHHQDGTIHMVNRIIIHEHFNFTSNGFAINDIALIHIATSFIIDSSRKSIPLAYINGVIFPLSRIFMYGWGDKTTNGKSTLKIYKTKALNKITCNTTYENYGGIYDNQGCASDFRGKTSLCKNDAGGPVVYKTRLIGVLFWTEGCGRSNYPNVFTEISTYRFWIRRHTGI